MRPSPASRSFAWSWLFFSLVLGALTVTWSLTTPMPSGPDEETHYVKAAAVVRGQFGGSRVPEKPAELVRVRVPAGVAQMGRGRPCYYRPLEKGASCDRSAPVPDRGTRDAFTYVGGYPPLYYLATGWPTLLSSTRGALQAMRVTSALLGSVLLGLAFATARRWSASRLLPLGLALGLTPMVFYLTSVMNPNGFEVCAAAVLWTAGSILVLERAADPPRGLVVIATAAAVLLALTRPLSPAFVVGIVAALGILRFGSLRLLVRNRAVQLGGAVAATVAVLAGVFVLIRHSYRVEPFPVPADTSTAQIIRRSVNHVPVVIRQLFGAYGSPNFGPPYLALLVWSVGLAVLVGAALLLLKRRDALLLGVGTALLLLLLPLVIDLASARSNGITWQGRYELPLALGIPVLAALLLTERGFEVERARVLAPIVPAVGLFVSWYWVAHRYLVGLSASLNPFPSGPDVWRPPAPGPVLFLLAAVLSALYGVLLHRAAGPRPRAPKTAEPVVAGATTGSAGSVVHEVS